MPYVNIKVTREGTSPDRAGVTPLQHARRRGYAAMVAVLERR